ncbi:MAG TPA: nucleoside hydrolase [Candidatus Acidoferrum sp.]|nr:nucleoside hydrolase [Candidatus Acidoferrum sp.]
MQTISTGSKSSFLNRSAKPPRRRRVAAGLVAAFLIALAATAAPIPVILDTDIGDDIDDTWALTMLLKSPPFDLKLVTTTTGKAEYRAKIVARMLTIAGRTDVAIGLGAGSREGTGGQVDWVRDYPLRNYPGRVLEDGVQALIDMVNTEASNGTPVTIIAIGPLETLNEALTRDPGIARKANFVGMMGSVHKGYDNKPRPEVEYNMHFIPGAKKVFAAPWQSFAITPLDTCGLVKLSGSEFEQVKTNQDALVQALLENYRIWSGKTNVTQLTESSVLFDTVAIYLADPGPKPLLGLETLNLSVSDRGMTTIDPAGCKMTVATSWTDLPGYRDFLLRSLTRATIQRR